MTSGVTFQDFDTAIKDLGSRFPRLSDDDLFTLWFLRARVTEDEEEAYKALVGGSNDKNIDAIAIDENARAVFIVQTKYRQHIGKHAEKLNEVGGFADVIRHIATSDESEFKALLKQIDPLVEKRVREARDRIVSRQYKPWLFFVTLGRVSDTVRDSAKQRVRLAKCHATLEIFDCKRAEILLTDYLDGVAPPIPALDLEMEKSPSVEVNGISQRYDRDNEIESWAFSMRGDAVAQLYQHAGKRLFARNIRGFLGKNTPMNRDMVKTLETEPDRFFYYNNGITILCDEAKQERQKGKDILHVSNPQVINGQQTTRTLANHQKLAAKATVLVKVIQVSRRPDHQKHFDGLVSKIVAGTNWQNQIRPSDLATNDRTQVAIERELRKFGYAYIRRRETKSEVKQTQGKKQKLIIKKGELAQIVAACDIDARRSRGGREKLFSEQSYRRVFPNCDPLFYLPRYWTMNEVRWFILRDKFRSEARWLVLEAIWDFVRPQLTTDNSRRTFIKMCEKQDATLIEPMSAAINRLYGAAKKYYAARKGKGKEVQPPPTFFKGRHGSGKPFLDDLKQDVATMAFLGTKMEQLLKALS